ncbi:hypothetical protein [Mycolicibacterium baixiangningiae]|uniref:hypothetical protein n=1 Tax=Mycolicibacterium baixiangningiae TaxID=2761578 RepID=UPI001E469D6D|nr:hypothetical protein [Mycolicibacterium baixiangningiae]
MLLVVALAVTVTILVTRDGSDGNSPTPPGDGQASEFASANDTGPVNIITEDPTCDAWGRISLEYTDALSAVGWADRDPAIPASAWTAEQRTMYEAATRAMTAAADQTENLARQTPHRVVRELYGQFIAYSRAFGPRLSSYTVADDDFLAVSDAVQSAMVDICSAINYRSAAEVAPRVEEPRPPSSAVTETVGTVQPFLTDSNSICPEWNEMAVEFDREIAGWKSIDPRIPNTDWTPDQRAANEAVVPVMQRNADQVERLGRQSRNAVIEDFATLSAQYSRAFVATIPTYKFNDNYLSATANDLGRAVTFACRAVS